MDLLRLVDDRWTGVMATREVRMSAPGADMLRLDAVEIGPGYNKPRTNLLLRCRHAGWGWEFFVDDDLQYLGGDEARRRMFAGPRLQHWQALVAPQPVQGDVHAAILGVLEWLDSPLRTSLPAALRREEARARPAAFDMALEGVATLCGPDELLSAGFEPTLAQAEAIAATAAAVTQQVAPCCPLVCGPSGSGKHAIARAAAGQLLAQGLFRQVLQVSGAAIAAGMIFRPQKEERLGHVLDAARSMEHALVLLDHFDTAIEQSAVACALVAQHLNRGLKLIAVTHGGFSLEPADAVLPLVRRIRVVRAPELDWQETAGVLRRRLACHPLAAKVELAAGLLASIVRAADRRPGASPGAAIGLLDALLAKAAWSGAAVIGPDDVLHLAPISDDSNHSP